jgi:hypothetical protein
MFLRYFLLKYLSLPSQLLSLDSDTFLCDWNWNPNLFSFRYIQVTLTCETASFRSSSFFGQRALPIRSVHAVLPTIPISHNTYISLSRAFRCHGGSSSISRYRHSHHHRFHAVTGEYNLMDNESVFNGDGNFNRTFSSYSSASQRDVRYRFNSHNSCLSFIQLFDSLFS